MDNPNSKVYVVQEVMRREGGELRRVHDLSPAAIYGEMFFLLDSNKPVLNPGPIVHELKRKLRDFSDDDCILAVGDPVAIGIACAVAASTNGGRVSILKWDRETRCYIKVSFEI